MVCGGVCFDHGVAGAYRPWAVPPSKALVDPEHDRTRTFLQMVLEAE